MKKNLVCVILVLTLLLLCVVGCSGKSVKMNEGTEGLLYEAKDGTYAVVGYTGTDVNVVIPDTYKGIPITAIARYAFYKNDVQSVVCGNNLSKVCSNAFTEASLLKDITFTSNSVTIEGIAFWGCISLSSIVFPDDCRVTIESVGLYESGLGQSGILDLSNISKESVIHIEAFYRCKGLTDLYFPENVQFDDSREELLYAEPSTVNHVLLGCDAVIHYGKTNNDSKTQKDTTVLNANIQKQTVYLPTEILLTDSDGASHIMKFRYNDDGTIADYSIDTELVMNFSYNYDARSVTFSWLFDDNAQFSATFACDEKGRPQKCDVYDPDLNETISSTECYYDEDDNRLINFTYSELDEGLLLISNYSYLSTGLFITNDWEIYEYHSNDKSDYDYEYREDATNWSLYSLISDINANNGELPENSRFVKKLKTEGISVDVHVVKQTHSSLYDVMNLFSIFDMERILY